MIKKEKRQKELALGNINTFDAGANFKEQSKEIDRIISDIVDLEEELFAMEVYGREEDVIKFIRSN